LVKDDLYVDIWRPQNAHDKIAEIKLVYSLSMFVSLSDFLPKCSGAPIICVGYGIRRVIYPRVHK